MTPSKPLAAFAAELIALETEASAAKEASIQLERKAKAAREAFAIRMVEEAEANTFTTVEGRTVEFVRKISVARRAGCSPMQLIEILDELGLGHLAPRTVLFKELRAWIQQRDEEHQLENPGAQAIDAIPPALRAHLETHAVASVKVRGLRG